LRQDAVLGVGVLHVGLGEVRVQLDLVDGGDDVRLLEQRGEVIRHEVADPDGANLAVAEQRLQCLVGLDRQVEPCRERLVQDQQVDLVNTQLGRALVECVQRLVIAVIADPDLRLDEDLAAVNARAADPLGDLTFVCIAAAVSIWRYPQRALPRPPGREPASGGMVAD
jgi:hypothetical protein